MIRDVLLVLLFVVHPTPGQYYESGGHPQEHRVTSAAEACREKLGHALGIPWTDCVISRLLGEQAAALEAGSGEYFPVQRHLYEPLRVDRTDKSNPRVSDPELLKNLLRNFSCDVEDGGSRPLRSMTWAYQPADPCGSATASSAPGVSDSFITKHGFLPAGEDLAVSDGVKHTVPQAEALCAAEPRCRGFTYFHGDEPDRDGAEYKMHFKSATPTVHADPSWRTRKRKASSVDCRPGERAPPPSKMRLTVDVLRESPPIFVVHDFVSAAECAHMMNETVPHMQRSVTFGGGTSGQISNHRRSYSVNMNPDYDDETNVITRMVRRKFAFARELADYEQLVEGEGQEPLNSVYYKDYDDQYRPHCDGQCHGGAYRKGERIATSLTYCDVADKGGHAYTYFSRSGIKVAPKFGQMLFFGYKHNPTEPGGKVRMDDGSTEHSGCPLREGRKWIATMWYREGMTAEKGWESYRGAGGV